MPCFFTEQAWRVALAAVEQLPREQQLALAARVSAAAAPAAEVTVLSWQRLIPAKQLRLAELLDKNGAGTLMRAEQSELRRISEEADRMLLANSEALALALRPELFDARGKPVKARFQQALQESLPKAGAPGRGRAKR